MAATFSPDGHFILTGEGDNEDGNPPKQYLIRLWNVGDSHRCPTVVR